MFLSGVINVDCYTPACGNFVGVPSLEAFRQIPLRGRQFESATHQLIIAGLIGWLCTEKAARGLKQ
jgi:hypothetical protein